MKNTTLTSIAGRTSIRLGMTIILASSLRLNAQSRAEEFVPFETFVERTESASPMHVRGPQSRVKGSAEFNEMRHHLITMYRGVRVNHSFVKDANHFDCIPVEQQPSVRALGIDRIAAAPPASMATRLAGPDTPAKQASQANASKPFDESGNPIGCEPSTIPMRRITLDEMTRFPTLREFLDKKPSAPATPAVSAPAHKYAYMQQTVDNLGGNSNLALWSPYVNTALGEVFTLSQEWYVGGSGAAVQTAEVGWQNFPSKYGSQNAALFIYWTADNYAKTGCYNLECAAFVQTAGSGMLGGSFDAYSTAGGDQYEFSAQFYLYQGNWWLCIDGNWIGYYPGSIYRGGQMTKHAQAIKFGTESVGTSIWPAEGSGFWSTSGWGNAAYQRELFFFGVTGAAAWDTLEAVNPSPTCYSASGPFTSSSSGWTVYFYAGGPGGPGC